MTDLMVDWVADWMAGLVFYFLSVWGLVLESFDLSLQLSVCSFSVLTWSIYSTARGPHPVARTAADVM